MFIFRNYHRPLDKPFFLLELRESSVLGTSQEIFPFLTYTPFLIDNLELQVLCGDTKRMYMKVRHIHFSAEIILILLGQGSAKPHYSAEPCPTLLTFPIRQPTFYEFPTSSVYYVLYSTTIHTAHYKRFTQTADIHSIYMVY